MNELDVLLVDDEEDLVHTMAERMVLRGIRAEAVLSGDKAVEQCRRKDFAVVIIDMKMPGMSGLETMRQIRRDKPSTPIIMMTGHGSATEGEQGLKEGAKAYVVKPIDLDELIEKVKQAVKGDRTDGESTA